MSQTQDYLSQFLLPPYIETYFESDNKEIFHPSVRVDEQTNGILTDYPAGFEWARDKEKEIRERVISLLHETEHGKKTAIVVVQHGIIKVFKNVDPDFLP